MSTLENYGTLFPTSVVGSMPRSNFVRDVVLAARVVAAAHLDVDVLERRIELELSGLEPLVQLG